MVEVNDDIGEDTEEVEGDEEQDDVVLRMRGEESTCALLVEVVDFANAAAGRGMRGPQEGVGGRGHRYGLLTCSD